MVTPARPGNGKAGGNAVQRQQYARPFSVETLSEKLTASPRRIAFAIVLAFTLVRLTWAYALGFGIDESYTIGQSRFLALSYFDHPPLHYCLFL